MATGNSNEEVKSFGNVLMADPNLVNTNQNMINSIPQYQDMFIFVELTAKSRGRSVVFTSNNSGLYSLSKESVNKDVVVNFMGNNQDSAQPNSNYLNFTTNWYDGSTGDRLQTEGFGISNIKVVINSSYIPQVNIQFIDLRGLAFFNQENSPYRILFNFPPPIFTLTLKGYYGKPLKYMLHLVKYTTEFKAENGNFIIDAQFIAMTFAPLTDVLFTYIVNFPLITDKISMNPAPDEPPHDTYELILKLKSLYSAQGRAKDVETIQYEQTLANIVSIDSVINTINLYKSNTDLAPWGKSLSLYMGFPNSVSSAMQITPVSTVDAYNTAIKNNSPDTGQPVNPPTKLILAYQLGDTDTLKSTSTVLNLATQNRSSNADAMKIALDTFINKLVNASSSMINFPAKNTPVAKQISAINTENPTTTVYTYMSLDITDFYQALYKKKTDLQNQNVVRINQINTNINNMIHDKLGMQPTIYNIFKILLDDVDKFFDTLRGTAYDAENRHHIAHKGEILNGNYKDVINTANNTAFKIFAFPLFIDQQKICNQVRETRIAPIQLSSQMGDDPFPEIKLVHDFINTFTLQRNLSAVYDMRSAQNADGTYLWIPVSPFDSVLGTGDYASPYAGVDTSGGGSDTQPIPLSPDLKIVEVAKIILKRFYILSQNVIPNKFYTDSSYVDFFAESEATNLVASIFNPDYVNLLLTQAKNWQNNVNSFYSFVQNNISDLYTFKPAQHPFFGLTDGSDIVEERTFDMPHKPGDAYVNKKNSNYSGLTWYAGPISVQLPATPTTTTASPSNPVQTFLDKHKTGFFKSLWKGATVEGTAQFTNQNVFYIGDTSNVSNDTNPSGIRMTTRFLGGPNDISISTAYNSSDTSKYMMLYTSTVQNKINQGSDSYNRIEFIKKINEISSQGTPFGNNAFRQIQPTVPIKSLDQGFNSFTSIIDVWVDQLADHDDEIYDTIIDYTNANGKYNSQLAALVLASNFGYTLSPFNVYPNVLSNTLFNIPAAIQTPSYVLYYMGALVDVLPGSTFYNTIYDFFVNGAGSKLNSCGVLIFADIIDINNQMATADKSAIQYYFPVYYDNINQQGIYYSMRKALRDLYWEVNNDPSVTTAVGINARLFAKRMLYGQLLDPNTTTGTNNYFPEIIQPIITRGNIVNYSEITFERDAPQPQGYDCLNTTNTPANGTKSTTNTNYFKGFFTNLYQEIKDKQTELKKQKEEDDKLGADNDIVTQTYYSFKNINDKWVSTPKVNAYVKLGYPFNEPSPADGQYHLIDMFAFVDRAMNPIGDTIINPAHLIELLNDENATVFSVLSELLAMNNFEFFPLQNFMQFENSEWTDSFRIDTVGDVTARPAFVCMYFGGSSSYPTGINTVGGQFNDDCIVDMTNPKDGGGKDFNIQTEGCIYNVDNDAQVKRNPFFPYGKVRAYRVRFAEQNQSMFTNIKIDSKEYPETNESIKILSRIAGDNKLQAPTPKGQNLYNLYENRSYKATVLGLGNMMLQPTQYFQIENVPLFNGAYITLSVEHNIEPNKMTTSVSGTKILKYPVPRVLEASSILGFEGGNSYDTNAGDSSASAVTLGPNGATIQAPQAQYNSMYDFKVQ